MDLQEEYETADYSRPVHALTSEGLSFNKLLEGVEFEVDEDENRRLAEEAAEDEAEEGPTWWSKEELLKHLEDHPNLHEHIAESDERTAFEVLEKKMEPIIPGMVFKRRIKAGFGEVLTAKSGLCYHYNAYLDGMDEPFDSTVLRGRPYLHRLNEDSIIRGLYEGLLTMRKEEKAEILVRPEYAFGALGCPPRIPGNSTILYVVEVLKVFAEGTLGNFEMLTFPEQQEFSFAAILKMCDEERISGNTYFKDKRYKEASFRYKRAIRILENRVYQNSAEEKEAQQLLIKLYNNQANTANQLHRFITAMSFSKKALTVDPENLKALYQYGKAKYNYGQYDAARELLLRAQRKEPQNPSVCELLTKLEVRVHKDSIQEKDLYSKIGKSMFG